MYVQPSVGSITVVFVHQIVSTRREKKHVDTSLPVPYRLRTPGAGVDDAGIANQ